VNDLPNKPYNFLYPNLLQKEVKDERRRGAELKIQSAIGFRHVIDLLSSEQKLIVGHNCFLGTTVIPSFMKRLLQLFSITKMVSFHYADIAHVYSKFLGPLPLTAEEFVSSINKYFPHIVDTKILLNANYVLQQRMKKSSTSLSSAFARLCPHIALGSESKGLAFLQPVEVEVQVDDMRFTCNSALKSISWSCFILFDCNKLP
jgi:poly(A)-specific ribonuclease